MNTLFARDLEQLSRREFLQWTKRGVAGLFGLFLAEKALGKERLVTPALARATGLDPALDAISVDNNLPEMGRVLDNSLSVYTKPSASSRLVTMYWRDLVFTINGVTIGDNNPPYNRVWYLINNQGYAHSGKVQPVTIQHNSPIASVPENGLLAEVTVPYTDAVWDVNRLDRFAYRLYYSTVYWIMDVATDKQGGRWYLVPDDKLRIEYYVNAQHLRPIPPAEITPLSPNVPAKDKRLEIHLNQQTVIGYEGSTPVFMTRCASGGHFIDGNFTTPTGLYMTNRKRPSRHMASEDLAAPSAYDLPGVPWVSYLTKSGISFHGTYWHNDFGKPRSHGCVNLSPQAARWVFRWTNPSVPYSEHTWNQDEGTRVDIVD